MDLRLKIHGGTAKQDEPSLCMSCKHMVVVRGNSLKEEFVTCEMIHFGKDQERIPFAKVTHCNKYKDVRHPTLREMEAMSWIIRTDGHKKQVGFVPMRDLDVKERPESLADKFDDW